MKEKNSLVVEQVCDECGEPAVWCAQMILKVYPFDNETGDFGDPVEPDDQDPEAEWYCAKCGKKILGVE
jgi:hypothetical protein